MRRIVEEHPGHDTMFYNVLDKAIAKGEYVEDVFGSQKDFYKHPLVEASRFCDNIFAVGDYVVKELRFLRKEFKRFAHRPGLQRRAGADAQRGGETESAAGSCRLIASNVLGFKPDYLLTHLTRLVPSKGLWRDMRVVEQLEKHLAKENKTAILFVLSTETCGRVSARCAEHGKELQMAGGAS